jgi:hypothetical protein
MFDKLVDTFIIITSVTAIVLAGPVIMGIAIYCIARFIDWLEKRK